MNSTNGKFQGHVMKALIFVNLIVSLSVPLLAGDANGAAWKTNFNKPIKAIRFLDDSMHILLASSETIGLYDVPSGQKVWDMELKGLAKKGIKYVLHGNKFLVSTPKTVQCYDAMTGSRLWETEVPGVDQNDYKSADKGSPNVVMIRYEDQRVMFDMNTGKILLNVTINSDLKGKGGYVLFDLPQQGKELVMLKDNKAGLFDINSGNQLFTGDKYEVNSDLVKKDLSWYYQSPDDKAILFVLEDEVVVIDAVQNKELLRRKLKIDASHEVLVPTTQGCAVLTKDQIVHFDFQNGAVTEINVPFADIRTMHPYSVNGKDMLVISLKNKLIAIDPVEGSTVWQSKDADPQFEGYVHRYIQQDGDAAILTYTRPRDSGDDQGTYVYLMRLNLSTGSIAYKIPVALGKKVVSHESGLFGSIVRVYLAAATYGLSEAARGTTDFGFSDIGFDYDITLLDNKMVVGIVTPAEMLNPDTRNGSGEGFCAVNIKTGDVFYKNYFPILEEAEKIPSTAVVDGNIAYFTGKDRLISFDIASGKKLWSLEKELNGVQITDMAVIDGLLYAKFGKKEYSVLLLRGDHSYEAYLNNQVKEDKIDFTKENNATPYGFLAIDPAAGKILWRIETEEDPALGQGDFGLNKRPNSFSFHSIALGFSGYNDGNRTLIVKPFDFLKSYNAATKELYFCDLEKVYSLKLGREGGKYNWESSLKKSDVGAINFEKAFAFPFHSRKKKLTQPLRFEYSGGQIVAYGPDGIAAFNPNDGKVKWKHEWSYDWQKIKYTPDIVGNKLVYCIDQKLTRIDLMSGSLDYQTKVEKNTHLYSMPDDSYLIALTEKEAAVYPAK